uniref:RIIa domain-containing protein n=3 Tax=Oncorhynchus TaxID=8016 RepID=A0A8C7N5D5_ONCKI
MSYSYPAKVNVPPGLRTLLEGLSRAVVKRRPDYISQFAQLYFAELLRFRTENPTLAIKALVREFNTTKGRPN